MTEVIHVTPPEWWQIVLVGMAGVPDEALKPWRKVRVGRNKMKARDFDNALRAGQREVTEARLKMTPGMTLQVWESRCRQSARERETELALWLASWDVVPYLARPYAWEWVSDYSLLQDLRALGIEPECWTYDDEHMDRVPVPGALKAWWDTRNDPPCQSYDRLACWGTYHLGRPLDALAGG